MNKFRNRSNVGFAWGCDERRKGSFCSMDSGVFFRDD
jgi:hypothetical protein